MQKISADGVWFKKRVVPAIFFGFLGCFLIIGLVAGDFSRPVLMLPFVIAPIVIGAFGYVLMSKLVWDLADEVHDGGSYLQVRRGQDEERIELSNVLNVCLETFSSPSRVTIRLVRPGRFGDQIAFSPRTGWVVNPFARNAVVDDLTVRVDRARRTRDRERGGV